jgi:prepilin-type N-terminal cleavage/methylation domain-containing protein
MHKKFQHGFSLIELLVVVAIVALLAAAGILAYSKYLDGARVDTVNNSVKSIGLALDNDLVAISNNLSGKSDLLKGLNPATPDQPTCQEAAKTIVTNLLVSTQNTFNKSNLSAYYGNDVRDDLPKSKYQGAVLISCTDPNALLKNTSSYRIYECGCTTSDCNWDFGVGFESPGNCPYPNIASY